MSRVEGATPVDVSELQKCSVCGKGMMHDGQIAYYEISVNHCVIDLPNIKRMHGLEMAVGGFVGLARVFSPDNTVAHRLDAKRHSFCMTCALSKQIYIAELIEES